MKPIGPLELSYVIPVFNGSKTIGCVVTAIHEASIGRHFEIVLVNDGSSDDSEMVCSKLVELYPETVFLVQLSRNFGEHNAVLAGLKQASGQYLAVLDDDGQNAPQDVLRMLACAKERDFDVVYARYPRRQHPWPRRLGSWINDKAANLLLQKPRGLYLCSFKLMNRFVVEQVATFSGALPYLDGLILRTTGKIGQIDVEHHPRMAGRSGYTLSKLVGLWLNMLFGFSLAPLRIALLVGIFAQLTSVAALCGTLLYKFMVAPEASIWLASVLAIIGFAAGVQLMFLGILGEYAGRVLLQQGGARPYILRYIKRSVEEVSEESPVREASEWRPLASSFSKGRENESY